MIRQLDDALAGWLRVLIPQAEVTFERRGASDAPARVELTLIDVREDAAGALAGWSEQRAADGTLAARLSPLRRYRLSYWVSAYASTVRAEHELLSQVLGGVASHDVVPAEHVVAAFGDLPITDEAVVFVRVAPAPGEHPGAAVQVPAALRRCAGLQVDLLSALPRIVDDRIATPPAQLDLHAGRPAYPAAPQAASRPGPRRRIHEH